MNYLFLDNGFEEIEAITTIDLLRRANIHLTTVSVTGKPMVLGAHNIAVEADGLIDDIDFARRTYKIGRMPYPLRLAQTAQRRRKNDCSDMRCSVCAGETRYLGGETSYMLSGL